VRSGGGIRIEVGADSMRVGKTTVVKVIAEGLRGQGMEVTESYEDWQHNPYLKGSYSDAAKNFLESQKWFVQRKWEQINDGGEDVFVQDVPPEMDYNYAETNRRLGRMSEKHFAEYEQFYRGLDWSQAPMPDLLVFLTASDRVLLSRAESSRREFETVEPEYFLMMKRVNEEWIRELDKNKEQEYRILKINTDNFDFAHDEVAKRELVARVRGKLALK
jgi:deoxyguanosine kinase